MKRIINIISSFCLITLISCGESATAPSEDQVDTTTTTNNELQVSQAQFEQSKMTMGSLEEKSLPITVAVNGMIDVPPENRAVVSATMGGYIKTTPLLVGDKVKKGQVLVTLENPEFVTLQQQYMEVNEQLVYLKSEYDRQIQMKSENITSQKSFLKAESDYKTAIARHTGLDRQLRMLNFSPAAVRAGNISSIASIYAPITGSITKVNVVKGSYLSPATEIMEIIDTDHIHLELSVFEKDIMKIKQGQEIDFKIPEATDESFKATVYLVGTSIQTNRTIQVHAHIENEKENQFLMGMFIQANIIVDITTAKALPNQAIVEVEEVFYVLELDKTDDDRHYFHKEAVEMLGSYEGYSFIKDKEGFSKDTKFLTRGAFNLLGM
jgi:cobalt-zinc-cadmium efflux system membrane fusion protein